MQNVKSDVKAEQVDKDFPQMKQQLENMLQQEPEITPVANLFQTEQPKVNTQAFEKPLQTWRNMGHIYIDESYINNNIKNDEDANYSIFSDARGKFEGVIGGDQVGYGRFISYLNN